LSLSSASASSRTVRSATIMASLGRLAEDLGQSIEAPRTL
jgi:hypothetical protein